MDKAGEIDTPLKLVNKTVIGRDTFDNTRQTTLIRFSCGFVADLYSANPQEIAQNRGSDRI